MSPKQHRFSEEYVLDLNGTAAARRAGYTGTNATLNVTACRLLHNAAVADRISALQVDRSRRTGITSDVILGELLRLARTDVSQAFDADGNMLPINQMPEDVRRSISSIEVNEEHHRSALGTDGESDRRKITNVKKLRFWDKKGALELLGKHLRLFVDKIEVAEAGNLAEKLAAARERRRVFLK